VMIYLAAGFGIISSILGLYFSYTFNLASGATIVLVATVIFLLVFAFSPKHGLLIRSLKAKKQRAALR